MYEYLHPLRQLEAMREAEDDEIEIDHSGTDDDGDLDAESEDRIPGGGGGDEDQEEYSQDELTVFIPGIQFFEKEPSARSKCMSCDRSIGKRRMAFCKADEGIIVAS